MSRVWEHGDIYTIDDCEFVAVPEPGNGGCDGCIGYVHGGICDMLPTGCGNSEIIWKPHNDAAKVLHVVLKLEGQ